MKDQTDTQTAELFPLPRRRGRPPTGQAMTSAERQKAYRHRKAAGQVVSKTTVSRSREAQLLAENDRLHSQVIVLKGQVKALQNNVTRYAKRLDEKEAENAQLRELVGDLKQTVGELKQKLSESSKLSKSKSKKRNVTKKAVEFLVTASE